jgi:hypothetical protein
MSQHGTDQILQVGYLRSCMDRRFVEATRHKFEEVTGLTGDRYYHEAFAGGALNRVPPPNPNPDGADYVYNLSVKPVPEIHLEVMGWQAHLDHCGGLPGRNNLWIRTRFLELVNSGTLQNKYPQVRHVFLLAHEDSNHQPIVEIIEPARAKL